MLPFENWSWPDEAMKLNYSWKRAGMLTFCFILIVLIRNSSALSDSDWVKNEFGSVHQEIRNLKEENANQNLEISLLKEKMESQDRTVHQKIIEELNKLLLTPEVDDHFLQSPPAQRNKRRVRLSPAKILESLLEAERKNDTDQPPTRRFFGPPSNCSDLALLGYTLNGYYLVMPSSTSTTSNSTDVPNPETIYCTFKQPEGSFNFPAVQKRIGVSKLNSGAVYFSANKRNIHYPDQDLFKLEGSKVIDSFDLVLLNLGDAFDQKTGVFTVPKNGVYQLMFALYFDRIVNERQTSYVMLNLNGRNVAPESVFPIAETRQREGENAAMQVIMQLSRGDRIGLIMSDGRDELYATFNGALLHELG